MINKINFLFQNTLFVVLTILFISTGFVTPVTAEQVADVTITAESLRVSPTVAGATYLLLRVVDPGGEMIVEKSSGGSAIEWLPPAGTSDGIYSYEVRVGVGEKRLKARDDSQQAGVGIRPLIQSGTVSIKGGAIMLPSEKEIGFLKGASSVAKIALTKLMDFIVAPVHADVLHYDDVIITGSNCIGFDCVDGESFGYATSKLKENNLRFQFDDTSTGSFPANDWQIILNDTVSGGASYFSIEDTTGGRRPFTIEAGAPANALYVEDYGRIGIGTSVPYVELHVVDGDTPTLRLDQDGSSGWTAQAWDMAGNETNFFVRDVTNGSTLPFRIQPGAPTSSISIIADGKVGLGTWSPEASLEIEKTGENADFLVERKDGATGIVSSTEDTVLLGSTTDHPLDFVVNNTVLMTLTNDGMLGIGTQSPAENLHVEGNALVSGNLELGSSRAYKKNIQPLNGKEAMDTLKALCPVRFNYKIDPDEESLGFIAEDVPALVATNSRNSLSPMDVVAVLTKVIQEQQKTIDELTSRVADIEKEKARAVSHGDNI